MALEDSSKESGLVQGTPGSTRQGARAKEHTPGGTHQCHSEHDRTTLPGLGRPAQWGKHLPPKHEPHRPTKSQMLYSA